MVQPKIVELVLTCGSWQEAQRIVDVLLQKQLIACAKFIPVESKYRWHGDIESSKEVLVLMESLETYFDRVETEVSKLHSYETFSLQMIPVEHISMQAVEWLNTELLNKTQ